MASKTSPLVVDSHNLWEFTTDSSEQSPHHTFYCWQKNVLTILERERNGLQTIGIIQML